MFKEVKPKGKNQILADYLKHKEFWMDSDKADEFNQLFDSFLTILSLKHNLKIDVKERENYSLDIFAKTNSGATYFLIIISSVYYYDVGYWQLTRFSVQVNKELELDTSSVNLKSDFTLNELGDWQYFDTQYSEEGMLDMIKCLVDLT